MTTTTTITIRTTGTTTRCQGNVKPKQLTVSGTKTKQKMKNTEKQLKDKPLTERKKKDTRQDAPVRNGNYFTEPLHQVKSGIQRKPTFGSAQKQEFAEKSLNKWRRATPLL